LMGGLEIARIGCFVGTLHRSVGRCFDCLEE